MDEIELRQILNKHRNKGITFFIISNLVFLTIHYFYDNGEAILVLAYSVGLIGLAMAIAMSFVEKVLLEVLNKLSIKDSQ